MGSKGLNFYAMSWFISVLICMILEGSYLGAHNTSSILNDLSFFTTWNIGGMFSIPAFNLGFFNGVIRLFLWDYSFYTGGFEFLRWFWLAILSPGGIWAIGQAFMYVAAQFVRVF